MMPSFQPHNRPAFLQAILVGVAYVLAVQLAFLMMPFTTETLWLWAFGIVEAIGRGQLGAFFASGEWWLALAFLIGIFALGATAAYAYSAYANPWPAVVAGGFLAIFYLTEVIFMGTFEYAIFYVAVTPLLAAVAIAIHLFSPRRGTGEENGGKDEEDTFVPSPLDLSVRYAHGGPDDEVERELTKIDKQARELEENRREK